MSSAFAREQRPRAGEGHGRGRHTSSTTPRSHRCAGSPSSRGCHICDTVICSVGSGKGNERSVPRALRCSKYEDGINAINSVAAAIDKAVLKLGTTTAVLRTRPIAARASSTGPTVRPWREVTTWSQAA